MSWFSCSRSLSLISALCPGIYFRRTAPSLPGASSLRAALIPSHPRGRLRLWGSGHSRAGSFSCAFSPSRACPHALSERCQAAPHARPAAMGIPRLGTNLGGLIAVHPLSAVLCTHTVSTQTPLRPSEEQDEIVLKGCSLPSLKTCYVFDSSLHVFQFFLVFPAPSRGGGD